MDGIIEFFKTMLDSESIITNGGIALVVLIVFLETGVFFMFFLPGDYLLFLAGLFCATGLFAVSIFWLTILIFVAAVMGYFLGYALGIKMGQGLKDRKESWFFKKKYIDNAEVFFNKWGNKSLVLCRFLPILRTFIPVIGGIVRYNFGQFVFYNIIGGLVWVGSLVLGGYFLGQRFPNLGNYVEYIILFFLVVTTFTVIRSWLQMTKKVVVSKLGDKKAEEEKK